MGEWQSGSKKIYMTLCLCRVYTKIHEAKIDKPEGAAQKVYKLLLVVKISPVGM